MSQNRLSDLSKVRRVFCDSREALSKAYEDGLARDAIVRTSAPVLALDPAIPSEVIGSNLSDEQRRRLSWWVDEAGRRLQDRLPSGPLRDVAIYVLSTLPSTAFRAHALDQQDLESPVCLIGGWTGRPAIDPIVASPWVSLLSGHKDVVRKDYQITLEEYFPEQPARSISNSIKSLMERRHIGLLDQLAYPFAISLTKLGISGRKGIALVMAENPLLRETASSLFRQGFGVKIARGPGREGQKEQPPHDATLEIAALSQVVDDGLPETIPEPIRASCIAIAKVRYQEEIQKYWSGLDAWRARVDELAGEKLRFALDAYPRGASGVALRQVCRERGVPHVAFQHGISREIAHAPETARMVAENAISDVFIAYGSRAKTVAESNPFRSGESHAVGLPNDYWRAGRSRGKRRKHRLLYISTALYAGVVQNLRGGAMIDAEMAGFELDLVGNVLARLPHHVTYKAYPAFRYPDEDPVLTAARALPKVDVVETMVDVRFMLPQADVLVTSRATSTLGWCLASGRPLVFLNVPQSLPLRDDVLDLVSQLAIVVDAGSSGYADRLRDVLSAPIEEIQGKWREMTPRRTEVFKELVGTSGPGAGDRAAQILGSYQGSSISKRRFAA